MQGQKSNDVGALFMTRLKYLSHAISALVSLLVLAGCDRQSASDPAAAATAELSNALKQVQDALGKFTPHTKEVHQSATQEWAKLSGVEYHVATFPEGTTGAQVEGVLKQLGTDRWDCFQVLERPEGLQIFCKRRPETYLRSISNISGFSNLLP